MLFHRIVMEPATLNRYAYVEGNPITKIDPSGYSSQPGSVGSILRTVGYKNRVLTAEFAKGMGNSGFIFNMDRRPILGVQFTTAHRICDVGGLIPIIGFGFDIGNVILYDLEGYKIKSVAAMAGAGLNLFGSGLLAKGTMSSLDNFAEAGVKYSDDVIEAGVKSGSSSLIDIDAMRPKLKTEPNTAFFWSGRTDGIGGAENAAKIAKNRGGVTLESTIESQKIVMPEWNFNNPSTMEAWDLASGAYAEQVSGEIRAVIGSELRPGNIWENVELPRLKNNPNVTKITTIDPKTGVENVIFER